MNLIRILILANFLAALALAQPVVNFTGNAASYDTEVARGSMVVLFGTGMGPSEFQITGPFPLLTTLAGASVKVTVNGVTTDGIMYYVSDLQSVFVLDSDTPAGTGTVTWTYNGQSSAPFPITVVDSNIGFYALDSSGTGPGVVTFHPNVNVPNPFPSNTNAINPGDIVILWANGLGPVPFEETIGAEFLDMTNVPLKLFANGQQVETIYRGRAPTTTTSVDILIFTWPEPAGDAKIPALKAANSCSSTISAQIGEKFSNLITVPAADAGTRICSDVPNPPDGEPTSPLNSILTQAQIDQIRQNGRFSFAFVGLSRDTNHTRDFDGPSVEQLEAGAGIFAEFDTNVDDALDGIDQFLGTQTCTTSQTTSSASDIDFFGVNFRALDAGPGILVNGPNGQAGIGRRSFGGLSLYLGQFPNGYLTEGTYALDSSPGGPDVGAIIATARVSSPLNWTNRQELMTVVRNSGFTASWSGPTSGWVTVSGESSKFDVSTFRFTTKSFACTAPATQGSLTVPGNIVSFVDASTAELFQFGQLSLDAIQLFELPGTGLDASVLAVIDAITQDVEYQ